MSRFCLVVELHRGRTSTNGATPSIYIQFDTFPKPQGLDPPPLTFNQQQGLLCPGTVCQYFTMDNTLICFLQTNHYRNNYITIRDTTRECFFFKDPLLPNCKTKGPYIFFKFSSPAKPFNHRCLHHWRRMTKTIQLAWFWGVNIFLFWRQTFFNAVATILCPYLARPPCRSQNVQRNQLTALRSRAVR